eukprot:PhF_6_TR12606/c1_g1_i5/m.19898
MGCGGTKQNSGETTTTDQHSKSNKYQQPNNKDAHTTTEGGGAEEGERDHQRRQSRQGVHMVLSPLLKSKTKGFGEVLSHSGGEAEGEGTSPLSPAITTGQKGKTASPFDTESLNGTNEPPDEEFELYQRKKAELVNAAYKQAELVGWDNVTVAGKRASVVLSVDGEFLERQDLRRIRKWLDGYTAYEPIVVLPDYIDDGPIMAISLDCLQKNHSLLVELARRMESNAVECHSQPDPTTIPDTNHNNNLNKEEKT